MTCGPFSPSEMALFDRVAERRAHAECDGLITLPELPLTPMQRKSRDEQLAAMRADALRGLPTVFGELL